MINGKCVFSVCTRWNDLVTPFWTKIKTFAIDEITVPKTIEDLPLKVLEKLLGTAGPNITNVSLDHKMWVETGQTRRVQFGKYLLMLKEAMKGIKVIELLTRVSGNISEIELKNMTLNKHEFAAFKKLVEQNPDIKKLRLNYCSMNTIFDDDLIMNSVEELDIYLYLHIDFGNLTFENFQGVRIS